MTINKNIGKILLESLLIVSSISISFYIESWRQDRDEKKRERICLLRMVNDLDSDSLQLVNLLNHFSKVEEITRNLFFSYPKYKGGSTLPVSNDSLALTIGLMTITSAPYSPLSTAYTSLKYNGQLGLVQNGELENNIIDYYEQNRIQHEMNDYNNASNGDFFSFVGANVDTWDLYLAFYTKEKGQTKSNYLKLYNDNRLKSATAYFSERADIISRTIRKNLKSNWRLRKSIQTEISR